MKIERIKIEGLWHEFNIDWSLYPDVNILVGNYSVKAVLCA